MTEGTNDNIFGTNVTGDGITSSQGNKETSSSTGDDATFPSGDGSNAIEFKIPDEYQTNQTIASAKSIEDLCKTIANQEILIGKKTIGIPDDKATPEDIAKFNEAFGVPTKFEDYTLESSPQIKAIYGDSDATVVDEFKKVLHEAGVNQKQAVKLKEGYDNILGGLLQEQKDKQTNAINEFNNLTDKAFGEAKAQKLDIAEKFMQEHLSPAMKPYLGVIFEDANQKARTLAIMADIANNIYPDLQPDDLQGGGASVGKSLEELNSEIQKVISTPEFQNKRHPGHEAKKAEWLSLAKQIDTLKNKK